MGRGISLTLLLGAVAALPPLGIDIGLPGLPLIEREFAASPASSSHILSLFLAGYAAAQLALGPLSDRFGRRLVLLCGLALFTFGGVGCALAGSMASLDLFRVVEGAGAASGNVMALAIIRDLFQDREARSRLAAVAVVLSLAPVVAPSLGAAILLAGGWRAIFGFLALVGCAKFVAVAVMLRETRPQFVAPPRPLAAYALMLRHPRAMRAAWINALNFAGMFAYVAGSPALLMGSLRVSAQTYGGLFALTAGGILVGAAVNGRLAARGVAAGRSMLWGLVGQTGTAAFLVLLMLCTRPTLLAVMPALVANTFCRGLVAPSATHAAMEPLPEIAGVSAAVVGALQMAVGGMAAAAVAALVPPLGAPAMTLVMLGCAASALAVGSLSPSGYDPVWREPR